MSHKPAKDLVAGIHEDEPVRAVTSNETISYSFKSSRQSNVASRRKILATALVSVIATFVVALVMNYLRSAEPSTPTQNQPKRIEPAAEVGKEPKSGVFALPGKGTQPKDEKRLSVSSAPAATVALAISPMQSYLTTKSIKSFIEQHLRQALAGDAEAAYAINLAIDECRFVTYTTPPTWLAQGGSSDGKFVSRRTAYEDRLARCNGIQDIPGVWQLEGRLRTVGADADYIPAVAASLSLSDVRSPQSESRARDILARVDGNSALSLYNYITQHNAGPTLGDPPQLLDRGVYDGAWFLAACDMGLDCGASSRLLETTCISTGRCGAEDYRHLLMQGLTAEQFSAADRLREQIVISLQAGNGSFFGLKEGNPR